MSAHSECLMFQSHVDLHAWMHGCMHVRARTHTHFRGIPTCFFARDYNSSLDVIVDESQKKSHSFDNAPTGTSLMNAVSHMHVWHTSLSKADAIAWVFRRKMTRISAWFLPCTRALPHCAGGWLWKRGLPQWAPTKGNFQCKKCSERSQGSQGGWEILNWDWNSGWIL